MNTALYFRTGNILTNNHKLGPLCNDPVRILDIKNDEYETDKSDGKFMPCGRFFPLAITYDNLKKYGFISALSAGDRVRKRFKKDGKFLDLLVDIPSIIAHVREINGIGAVEKEVFSAIFLHEFQNHFLDKYNIDITL